MLTTTRFQLIDAKALRGVAILGPKKMTGKPKTGRPSRASCCHSQPAEARYPVAGLVVERLTYHERGQLGRNATTVKQPSHDKQDSRTNNRNKYAPNRQGCERWFANSMK